ncbi:MAG TPA: PrgI family protein [Candidatus Paceibacterota bacterium]|nr:PrgI family protein [Candidatus Paceibacterota bacterium]
MQFKVPQFLDIEDKIFGPFTFRQFTYLAGGAGLCYIIYKLLGIWYGSIPIIIFAGLSLALTFYRPNGKPFIFMLQAAFKFLFQDKLYIWQRRKGEEAKGRAIAEAAIMQATRIDPKLSGSKLRDLAWSLDVLDMKK